MFFFITLYMQNVLHYSPIAAGAAYLPVTAGVGISTGITTKLLPRTGTRPVLVAGLLLGATGVAWLSRIGVHGSYLTSILPRLAVMALGLGAVFVGVQTAATTGVPADKAGLAAALITASSTVGGALGLAVFSAVAAGRTHHLLTAGAPLPAALTAGFQAALLACAIVLAAAAIIATRAAGTGQQLTAATHPAPDPETMAHAA